MEIKLENHQILLEKLVKLKCVKGCQNLVNYMIFDLGLYCTACLSKLNDISPDHFVTLDSLSHLIAEFTQNYEKSNKTGSNLVVLRAEIQLQNKQIKRLRDILTVDIKSIYSKSNNMLMNAEASCQKAYRNQALQNFFEPDITASILLHESELLVENAKNLIVKQEKGKVSYQFMQKDKQPEQVFEATKKTFKSLRNSIEEASQKIDLVMKEFRSIRQSK